eukprot:159461-Prymnesium_polylepis.1
MCAGPCGRLPEPPATALVHRTPCPAPPSHPSHSLTHPAPALLRTRHSSATIAAAVAAAAVASSPPSPPPPSPPSPPRSAGRGRCRDDFFLSALLLVVCVKVCASAPLNSCARV